MTDVTTWKITEVKETINKIFPNLEPIFDTCLSVIATLKLQDLKDPTGLNLIGDPSSEKGTVLSCFYGCSHIYRTDGFTPKSFVTGLNVKDIEKLKQIDMLPRIENECMLLPELAPIFGKRKEDLIENLSILTRIFDGQGLTLDFGTVGRRGYERPITFAWLGATTPLPYHVWHDMIRLGTRMFFLEIPKCNQTTEDLIYDVFKGQEYNEKILSVNTSISSYLAKLFSSGVKDITWDKEKDDDTAYFWITKLAELLVHLRAPLETWRSFSTENELEYEYVVPMTERPKRAMQVLYNIARGHAIIYGRDHIYNERRCKTFSSNSFFFYARR